MVLDAVSNFVRGNTDAAVGTSDTTVSVADASIFPDPATDGEFNVVIWDVANFPRPDQDADVEIVRVTGRDTGAGELTVVRGQETTSAAAHPEGSAIHLSPTAKMFSDIEAEYTAQGENFDGQGTSEFMNLQSVSAEQINNVEHISPDEDLVSVLDSVGTSTKLLLEPDATYQISGEIAVTENNIVIEGAGIDSTTIEFAAETGDNMFLVGQTSDASNFVLRDVTLDCSLQTEPADLGVGSGDVDKSPGNGVFIDGEGSADVSGSLVENVRILNAANEAIPYFGSEVFARELFGTVRNCEIINPRFRGIHPHFDHTVAAINNTFKDCTQAFDGLIRHSHTIIGNRFENCAAEESSTATAALIVGSDFASVIANNTFEGCGNPNVGDIIIEAGIVAWKEDRDLIFGNSFVDNNLAVCLSTFMIEGRGGAGVFRDNTVIDNNGGGIFLDKDNAIAKGNTFRDLTVDNTNVTNNRQGLIRTGGSAVGLQIKDNDIIDGTGTMPAIEVLDPGENYIQQNHFDTSGYTEFISAPSDCVVRENELVGGDNSRNGVLNNVGDGINQTIPDSTWTKIEWANERTADELVVDVSTDDNDITVLHSGTYHIDAFLRWDSDSGWSTGDRIFIGVAINGGQNVSGEPDRRFNDVKAGTETQSVSISTTLDLSAGDTLDIRVFQESGASKDLEMRLSDPFWEEFVVTQIA